MIHDNPIKPIIAERERFELSDPRKEVASLANWWNKPLSHLSKAGFLLRGQIPHQLKVGGLFIRRPRKRRE